MSPRYRKIDGWPQRKKYRGRAGLSVSAAAGAVIGRWCGDRPVAVMNAWRDGSDPRAKGAGVRLPWAEPTHIRNVTPLGASSPRTRMPRAVLAIRGTGGVATT